MQFIPAREPKIVFDQSVVGGEVDVQGRLGSIEDRSAEREVLVGCLIRDDEPSDSPARDDEPVEVDTLREELISHPSRGSTLQVLTTPFQAPPTPVAETSGAALPRATVLVGQHPRWPGVESLRLRSLASASV